MQTIDLLERKRTHFVLWRPRHTQPAPALYIGVFADDNSPYANFQELPLRPSSQCPDLWEIAACDCGLSDGQMYHYWFKVRNSSVYNPIDCLYYCTDPLAYAIDRKIQAPEPIRPDTPDQPKGYNPASVILYRDRELVPCDTLGKTANWEQDQDWMAKLPPNNKLVIYELPTRWTYAQTNGKIGTGTFKDVLSLLRKSASAPDYYKIPVLQQGTAYLMDLGVNALELLPPQDSGKKDNQDAYKWGYGTANYFSSDFDLGCPAPEPQAAASPNSTSLTDLVELIKTCHARGVRFFLDVVMAFSKENPYRYINFLDFFVQWQPDHAPDRDPELIGREGFGGDLIKYAYETHSYHPITGQSCSLYPAREYLKTHLVHWLNDYRIDGLRLDSVNNVKNYDFLQEFKDLARQIWRQRGGADDRFLVVGEELSVPLDLLHQNRLEGLWNERFKQIIRKVLLGESAAQYGEPSFEWSVRKAIDCRLLGFWDGTQAVNYLTSHDVGGANNERLYDYLVRRGVHDAEKRIKLGFACLLTAVGIPMILAGDEFADQHDLPIDNSKDEDQNKQVDPVNYERLQEDWRHRIFEYVARLVKFRTQSDALSVNDTRFIHADFSEGKRVVVWQRGIPNSGNLVVVVANFSDYGTPDPLNERSEYGVPNFPAAPQGKCWKEITQDRLVDSSKIGREPIFPWEAKVYALVNASYL